MKMRKKVSKNLKEIAGIILIGFLLYFWINYGGGLDRLAAVRDEYGYSAIFVLIPIIALLSVTPFPSEVVAFTASLILGFQIGVICIRISWILGGILEYHIVARAAKNMDFHKKSLPKFLRKLPVDSYRFLICGLWFPLGSHTVTIMSATHGVPLKKYIIAVTIGYIPLSIVVAALANSMM